MLNPHTVSVASAFWAAHLGCSPGELFSEPLRLITHGPAWVDYDGAFALFRGGGIVSVPAERADTLRALLSPLSSHNCSPDRLASVLQPIASAIVGPAWTGYAEAVPAPVHPARALGPDDAPALAALQQACDAGEWAHGGSDLAAPCSAVFVDGQMVALAGYEVWGGRVAHLSVVTHPGFRRRGFGHSAVAGLAARAIAAGLLPQYRTLAANRASVRVAGSLGFQIYATSMAVQFHR